MGVESVLEGLQVLWANERTVVIALVHMVAESELLKAGLQLADRLGEQRLLNEDFVQRIAVLEWQPGEDGQSQQLEPVI